MRTITLDVPEAFDLSDKEFRLFIAAKLYEAGRISSGYGAQMADISRREFIESLYKYDVSIFNYNPEEIARDLKNLQSDHL